MNANIGGRGFLIEQLGGHGLSRRRSLRVLNYMFKQIKRALARGEKVEFAGGRLLRVDPAKVNRSRYNEENWPAHWPLWTVIWVPHWETLIRLVGREEAQRKAEDWRIRQLQPGANIGDEAESFVNRRSEVTKWSMRLKRGSIPD
jgi:hypothetical protein